VNTNFAFLNSIIAYNATGTVSLDLQRNAVSFLDAASTRNQRAVAAAADTLGTGHDVYDRLVTMDEGSARAAFTALAGDLHASVQSAVVDDQRQVRDAVTRRLTDADEGRQGARGDDGHGVTAWVSVLGRDADYDGNANAGKIDGSGSGALLGIDVSVDGDARVGVLVGHGTQSLHERSLGGSADVRSNPFGLYGDIAFDALALRGGVVHASHDIDTTRRVTLGATTSSLKAHRDADTTQAFAELGYAFEPTTRARVEPFVQVATVRWSGDDATERGGRGALSIDNRDAHVTSGKLGLHAALATDAAHAVGWQATLAWQHASGDTTPSSRLRFAEGGAGFDVTGVPLARNAATVDAGLTFRVTPAVHLDASYTGQYASGLTDHGGRLGLGVDF
jgi:outer membrane autotransporter protein